MFLSPPPPPKYLYNCFLVLFSSSSILYIIEYIVIVQALTHKTESKTVFFQLSLLLDLFKCCEKNAKTFRICDNLMVKIFQCRVF